MNLAQYFVILFVKPEKENNLINDKLPRDTNTTLTAVYSPT